MSRQEIYLSTSKHRVSNEGLDEALLEFENGSKIISVDLASINSRSQRANIVLVDGNWMKLQTRKHSREAISDLKWHQKLRIELDFLLEDIKCWVFWIVYKIKKGE